MILHSVEGKRSQTADKVLKAIEKMDERIKVHRTQTLDKDEGKTTSLGTSKLNYLDPRLTFVRECPLAPRQSSPHRPGLV